MTLLLIRRSSSSSLGSGRSNRRRLRRRSVRQCQKYPANRPSLSSIFSSFSLPPMKKLISMQMIEWYILCIAAAVTIYQQYRFFTSSATALSSPSVVETTTLVDNDFLRGAGRISDGSINSAVAATTTTTTHLLRELSTPITNSAATSQNLDAQNSDAKESDGGGNDGLIVPSSSSSLPSVQRQESILLSLFCYGKENANSNFMHMFIESARITSPQVNFLIIGDTELPYSNSLPRNVRHVIVTWDDLMDRIVANVLNGQEVPELRNLTDDTARSEKTSDFKPLVGYLFPEYVLFHDWWGHIGEGTLIGNIRSEHFLTPEVLKSADILTAYGGDNETGALFTWGAFTMYRNTPTVNELFRLSGKPLMHTLGNPSPMCFDEWGECNDQSSLDASMSGIIHKHAKRLGIRWHGNAVKVAHDRRCELEDEFKEMEYCNHCVVQSNGVLIDVSPEDHPGVPTEVAMCIYMFSKQRLDASLLLVPETNIPGKNTNNLLTTLLQQGQFQASYRKGFEIF